MAVVSLILSLAGLVTLITAPVGAVLGHMARKQIRETGEEGDGLALAGIIVGWIITGLCVLACCVARHHLRRGGEHQPRSPRPSPRGWPRQRYGTSRTLLPPSITSIWPVM